MLDALGIPGQSDWMLRADEQSGRREEDKRLLGNFVSEFGGMRGVVAANANDLAGIDGSEKANLGGRPGVRAAAPRHPGSGGDFAHAVPFQNAKERRGGLGGFLREESAESHREQLYQPKGLCQRGDLLSLARQMNPPTQESAAASR